jgi:hypothetical protein
MSTDLGAALRRLVDEGVRPVSVTEVTARSTSGQSHRGVRIALLAASTVLVLVGVLAAVVVGVGTTGSEPARPPSATAPTARVDVVAGPGLVWNQKEYVVPAGRVGIHFSGASGLTFGFDDPRFRACQLGTSPGSRHTCRLNLPPGRYLVYDMVPSHRAVGLEATIVATSNGQECPSGQVASPVSSGPRCVAAKH